MASEGKSISKTWSLFQALGNLVLPYWFIHCLDRILNGFRTSHITRFRHAGKDNWALVTGASDGIGFGFANELAERGFNIVLHGRNLEKLKQKESLINQAYPLTKTRIWIADSIQDIDRRTLDEVVKGIHLTLLINNVGGLPPGGQQPAALEEQTFENIDKTIQMNIRFTTKLENALLPELLENHPSCILNISSLSAMGGPLVSVYAGTKGYLNAHSLSLQNELWGRKKDVTVHAIQVGKVISNVLKSKPAFATPDARTMAKATLDNVGLGRVLMTPYLPHLIQSIMLWLLPERLGQRFIWDAIASTIKEGENSGENSTT